MLASACSVPVKHKWESLKYYYCKRVLGTLLEQVSSVDEMLTSSTLEKIQKIIQNFSLKQSCLNWLYWLKPKGKSDEPVLTELFRWQCRGEAGTNGSLVVARSETSCLLN